MPCQLGMQPGRLIDIRIQDLQERAGACDMGVQGGQPQPPLEGVLSRRHRLDLHHRGKRGGEGERSLTCDDDPIREPVCQVALLHRRQDQVEWDQRGHEAPDPGC